MFRSHYDTFVTWRDFHYPELKSNPPMLRLQPHVCAPVPIFFKFLFKLYYIYFHFFALVLRQRVALIYAIKRSTQRNSCRTRQLGKGERSFSTLASLCLHCCVRDIIFFYIKAKLPEIFIEIVAYVLIVYVSYNIVKIHRNPFSSFCVKVEQTSILTNIHI